jgi:hypothetical protein
MKDYSFPRSADPLRRCPERLRGRSASSFGRNWAAERPKRCSHAERGYNE